MKMAGTHHLSPRWSLPLGAETLLALATAYCLYALSGHVYCDQSTQDSRVWLAAAVVISLPPTWFLASRRGKVALSTTCTVLVTRILLAAFVFLLLQPYSGDWYMEC